MESISVMEHSFRILIIEDDAEIQALLKEEFFEEGYRVSQALNGEEALDLIQKGDFDLVITDLRIPKGNGLDLVTAVKKERPEVPVIVITAFGEGRVEEEAYRLGASRFLSKPFRMEQMKLTVKEFLTRSQGELQP